MTNKKKDSIFSRIKNKLFSSKEEDEFELIEEEIYEDETDEYEARYHDEDELEDRTDPNFVMAQEVEESEADQVEENLSFPDDSDEDEILEALESPSPPPLDLGDEEDEPFEAQPMSLSPEEKEDLEDEMEDLDEEFPEVPMEMPKPEKTREIDISQMEEADFDDEEPMHFDEEEGDFSEFQVPGQKRSFKEKVLGLGSKIKSMIPSKGSKPSFTPSKPSRFKLPEGLDWDEIYNKIFSVETRPTIHRGFLALLFAFTTYGVGKMTALAIKGSSPQVTSLSSSAPPRISYRAKPEMNTVAKTDLFNAPGEIAEDPCKKDPLGCKANQVKPKDEKKVCVKADIQSELNIKLVNTLVLQDSVKSIAAVQIRNAKDVLNLREGEKIKDMAQIGKIDRQKMVFKNLKTGNCEYIANIDKNLKKMTPLSILSPSKGKKLLKKGDPAIKNNNNIYNIKKDEREKMLSNISEVLTQARAIQITNPDGSLSFKITEIVPNSIYAKLGIENDDIVNSVNGKKITNVNELMTLFGNIRQIDHFELGILRNGAEVSKEYNFD